MHPCKQAIYLSIQTSLESYLLYSVSYMSLTHSHTHRILLSHSIQHSNERAFVRISFVSNLPTHHAQESVLRPSP